jgi:hypothetical protein
MGRICVDKETKQIIYLPNKEKDSLNPLYEIVVLTPSTVVQNDYEDQNWRI